MTTENRKPTIAELEAMLADDRQHRIIINPDGSITAQVDDPEPSLPNIPITCANCERWKTVYIASQEMLRDLMADAIDNALEQSGDYEKLPDGRWKKAALPDPFAVVSQEDMRVLASPNFRQSPSPMNHGAESVHSGKQNTADKSGASPELLPTQLEEK